MLVLVSMFSFYSLSQQPVSAVPVHVTMTLLGHGIVCNGDTEEEVTCDIVGLVTTTVSCAATSQNSLNTQICAAIQKASSHSTTLANG
jgi:hypothetical protein